MSKVAYVSYASAEKPVAEIVVQRLRRGAIDCRMEAHLSDGDTEQEAAISQAIAACRTCIVLVGSRGLAPLQWSLIRTAVDSGLRVVPVLLPGGVMPADLPPSLELAAWVTLHQLDDEEAFLGIIGRVQHSPDRLRSVPENIDDGDKPVDFSIGDRSMSPGQESTEVFLGAASPRRIPRDTEFVARFAAYTESFRGHVAEVFQTEAPSATQMMDLDTCQWQVGTKVAVGLSGRGLTVDNSPQQFGWNGKWVVLRFDVFIPLECALGTKTLKFDITIEGITIATLRPEIEVVTDKPTVQQQAHAELCCPKTAFASYASKDRGSVLSRVRSLQICAGIDVFVDCLSLRPADRWKSVLESQIGGREVFLLFWSKSAADSPWVEWEWRTALRTKGLDVIQPHPLEPSDVAPPPEELDELQFGNAYERYIMELKTGP